MGVLIEIWSGLSDGEDVNELNCLPSYPDQPESQIRGATFEFANNPHRQSGIRARAYFLCSMSGNHTFSIKCDDQCRFTVKADEDFSESLGYHEDINFPGYRE